MTDVHQLIAEHEALPEGTPTHKVIRVIEDTGEHYNDELRRLKLRALGYADNEVTELLDALYLAVEALSDDDRSGFMHMLLSAVPADEQETP